MIHVNVSSVCVWETLEWFVVEWWTNVSSPVWNESQKRPKLGWLCEVPNFWNVREYMGVRENPRKLENLADEKSNIWNKLFAAFEDSSCPNSTEITEHVLCLWYNHGICQKTYPGRSGISISKSPVSDVRANSMHWPSSVLTSSLLYPPPDPWRKDHCCP